MKRKNLFTPNSYDLRTASHRNEIRPAYFVDEIWLPLDNIIPNVQPWYLISNYGRVYSKQSGHILKTDIINSGYERVQLYTIDGKRLDTLIHRLVLMTFKPLDDYENMQVNHIDTIKTNNRLNNLEWVNNSENMIHAYSNNLRKGGEDHMWAKLTSEQVHLICQGIVQGMSIKDICEQLLNIEYNKNTRNNIALIRKGKNWKSISSKYGIC